jgi:hypothetical protein
MDEQYKNELLKKAFETRIKEVTEYQVNIDNFRLAINKIKNDEYFVDFKNQLENLLKTSLYEQSKAKIMLEVIQSQLEK